MTINELFYELLIITLFITHQVLIRISDGKNTSKHTPVNFTILSLILLTKAHFKTMDTQKTLLTNTTNELLKIMYLLIKLCS